MDNLTSAQRTKAMQGSRSKNTKPEMLLRKHLHAMGFRFRLHVKGLPGTPDVVLPKYRAVIEVQGCFWHGHNCRKLTPVANASFWASKILGNRNRDEQNLDLLKRQEWRVCKFWECALSGTASHTEAKFREVADWLRSDVEYLELGKNL